MKSFDELVHERQSCRAYAERPVDRALLEDVCRTALQAPSACNSQPWKIYLATDPHVVGRVAPCFHAPFCKEAPAFAVIAETDAQLKPFVAEKFGDTQYFAQMDIGIMVGHLVLAAKDRGVDSCILGMFDEPQLRAAFGIPDTEKPRLAVCFGYAKEGDPLRSKIRKREEETLIVDPSGK